MEELLHTFNLNDNEVEALKCLISAEKPIRSSIVAKEVGLPRQTIYSILAKLSSLGLVVVTDQGGTKNFYSSDSELLKYIDLERDRLLKARNLIKGGSAYTIHTVVDHHLPQVHFYSGSLGQRKLFESILDVYKKGKSKKFRGYGINQFSSSKILSDYLKYFVKKRASYGVKTNLFIGEGADDFGITSLGRTIKHIKIEAQMAGIYFVMDRMYLFSYKDNIGVMIENKAIVQMLKDIFDDHWNRV